MLRVIREVEPPTPISRISTSEALPSLAANRHIEPARLSRFVRGDLDWIVMKALAKERERRYDSAIGLANDIERFTQPRAGQRRPADGGVPAAEVRAAEPGPQVVAASLVLLALVGGIVGTTLGLVEAQAAGADRRRRVRRRRSRQAEAASGAGREAADQIEKANEILGSIFKDLDPENAEKEGKPLSALLGERLDQATAADRGGGDRRPAGRGADADDPGRVAARPGLRREGDRPVHQGPRHLHRQARPRPPRHAHEHEQPRR